MIIINLNRLHINLNRTSAKMTLTNNNPFWITPREIKYLRVEQNQLIFQVLKGFPLRRKRKLTNLFHFQDNLQKIMRKSEIRFPKSS